MIGCTNAEVNQGELYLQLQFVRIYYGLQVPFSEFYYH